MKKINEIMDEMSKLRNKAHSVARDGDAMWERVHAEIREISTSIIDYWLSNGGLDGKYFKAPYYCQDWDTMNLPAFRYSERFVRIDKFLYTVNNAAVCFCGRSFNFGDNLNVDCSFDDRPNQGIRISKLHPDNLITKEEFEKAEIEYQKRFDKYVDNLIKDGMDVSNRIVGFSSGSEVKCVYNGAQGLRENPQESPRL